MRVGRFIGISAAALIFIASLGVSAATKVVDVLDVRELHRTDLSSPAQARRVWDTMHVASAMQGLANRNGPNVFLLLTAEFGVATDAFWLEWVRKEDPWLRDATFRNVSDWRELVRNHREKVRGLVVYDESVAATANVASTVAGIEDLLPVRWDADPGSVFQILRDELGIPVKRWLVQTNGASLFVGRGSLPGLNVPSSGSAKTDAYLWALEMFLKKGRCRPGMAAYYIDAYWLKKPTAAGADLHTLSCHDYFISKGAFFFDLSPWGDEAPVDDPGQPMGGDKDVFLKVLATLASNNHGKMVKVGGFVPWPHKYTTHAGAGKHEPVPAEWEFARLLSQYNAYMEADAAGLSALANASFFTHYPLRDRYPQRAAKPTVQDWKDRGYLTADERLAPRFFVGHYGGDYDAPSWLAKAVPAFFKDKRRGEVPVGWAFDPNLADRVPQALVYAYQHATTNDFFIAGDSGAGYINARALTVRPDSKLPSGLDAWIDHCRPYYRRWDMSVTGFVLDGAAGASTELEFRAYARISPDGMGTHFEKGPRVAAGVGTCPERDLPDSVEQASEIIAQLAAKKTGKPGFLWARSILKSPGWYAELSQLLRTRHPELAIEVVDPYTFFGLVKFYRE